MQIRFPGMTCVVCGGPLPPGSEAEVHPTMRGPQGGKKYYHAEHGAQRLLEREAVCPDCDGEGLPLPEGADYEQFSKCGNCKGWIGNPSRGAQRNPRGLDQRAVRKVYDKLYAGGKEDWRLAEQVVQGRKTFKQAEEESVDIAYGHTLEEEDLKRKKRGMTKRQRELAHELPFSMMNENPRRGRSRRNPRRAEETMSEGEYRLHRELRECESRLSNIHERLKAHRASVAERRRRGEID